MKRRQYDDDDGRVIAPMNIDGMPYNTGLRGFLRKQMEKRREEKESDDSGNTSVPAPATDRRTEREITFHAVLAALFIALIFGGCIALFILFCTNIWFA
ncbi:MAG TPA: hypothetical protein GX704_03030 [Clostridiales bacterium]|jgi:hypothetical protein|nr:hypothetical protein [Clostridiales bacterium]